MIRDTNEVMKRLQDLQERLKKGGRITLPEWEWIRDTIERYELPCRITGDSWTFSFEIHEKDSNSRKPILEVSLGQFPEEAQPNQPAVFDTLRTLLAKPQNREFRRKFA